MKPVVSQTFFTTQQLEPVCCHNQMQVAGFLTNRTAAPVDNNPVRNPDFKLYIAAMAST
jgi:hypothetical protein